MLLQQIYRHLQQIYWHLQQVYIRHWQQIYGHLKQIYRHFMQMYGTCAQRELVSCTCSRFIGHMHSMYVGIYVCMHAHV